MDDAWIFFTIAAAAFQCSRAALQKHLTSYLSHSGVVLTRFLIALPFSIIYFFGLTKFIDYEIGVLSVEFFLYAAGSGICLILGTSLLVYCFSFRNFAVSITYARTEAFFTALFGVLLFGEAINQLGWLGITLSLIGVVAITIFSRGLNAGDLVHVRKSALLGLGIGILGGFSALFLREASLSIDTNSKLIAAAITVVVIQAMETVIVGTFVIVRDPRQYILFCVHWKQVVLAGLAASITSVCWITAMTLQQAGYVKALGQIEFVFTLLVSMYVFRERSTRGELFGMSLVVGGIGLLLVGA